MGRILGSVIIAAILNITSTGVTITLPAFKWATADDLFGKILSAGNLLLIIETGLVFMALAGTAIALSGGSVVRFFWILNS